MNAFMVRAVDLLLVGASALSLALFAMAGTYVIGRALAGEVRAVLA